MLLRRSKPDKTPEMNQSKEMQPGEADEQWDGTDIEPGHPRNTEPKPSTEDEDAYFRSYGEGDRFP